MEAGREMEEDVSVRSLLYTEKGVEWGVKIWDEFEKEMGKYKKAARRGHRREERRDMRHGGTGVKRKGRTNCEEMWIVRPS